jgi:MFS family permease
VPADAAPPTLNEQFEEDNTPVNAFAYRDFRLLWTGLLISNTGSWMQYLAQGWLVVDIAESASRGVLYLGFVGLVRATPALLLSGIAGTLADRMDRRRILVVAQIVMGGSALVLGVLAATHAVTIWEVMALAAVSSAGQAFDAPTRQSLVPHIVGKRALMNAIGLNSAAFNGPAIIGPALAGLLVAAVGIVPCFYLNAASYVAVLVAVWMMSPKPPMARDRRSGFRADLLAGFKYVHGRASVLALLVLSMIFAVVGRPFIQLLPAFAKGVLHAGPAALGVLGSSAGAGALCGSITTAFIGLKHRRGVLLLVCGAVAGAALFAFSQARALPWAGAALVFVGVAINLFMGMANTLLQWHTDLEMRGRVMSLFTMTFLGLMPLGTWLLGTVASFVTLPVTLAAAGAIIVVACVAFSFGGAGIRSLE